MAYRVRIWTALHGGSDQRELGQHGFGSFMIKLGASRKIVGTRIDWVGLEIERVRAVMQDAQTLIRWKLMKFWDAAPVYEG
jgi:hypothetical protein